MTWGLGVESLDWNTAAEKAAVRVHEANPNLLIIVGGIFTGGYLGGAAVAPVHIPNQVSFTLSLMSPAFPSLKIYRVLINS